MKSRTFSTFLLVVAICISLTAIPNVNSQSAVVTTTMTLSQPSSGKCAELSLPFSAQKGKEIFGTFGSDSSVSFYIVTPADFMLLQSSLTCSLPPSSRPLYSETNVVGYGNNYRTLQFPADGTYYIVFVVTGQTQLVSGYANIQLTYPSSLTFIGSVSASSTVALLSSVASSSIIASSSVVPSSTVASTSVAVTSSQGLVQSVTPVPPTSATQNITQSTTAAPTVASAGSSFGILGIVGVILVIAIVASALVFMRRGKGPRISAQKQEIVQEEIKPPVASPARPRVEPEVKQQLAPAPSGGSISTGYPELDNVLAGGLPVGYAILIVSPPCDERDLLFRKIIESSIARGSQIFFLSRDLIRTQDFANRYKSAFHVFSPQADKLASAGGQVYKIQSLRNLSDLNISFTKAVETLPKNLSGKLVIIDLLSDVLLELKALTTRKWLDDFIGKRKAEGFTIIGVLNPLISTEQDTQTITDLFDGVIEIYERELKERARRFLIVKKLYGRKYIDTEMMLDKDKLY